jgi:hypothetical protein
MRRLPMISFLFLVLCATTVLAQSANVADLETMRGTARLESLRADIARPHD